MKETAINGFIGLDTLVLELIVTLMVCSSGNSFWAVSFVQIYLGGVNCEE